MRCQNTFWYQHLALHDVYFFFFCIVEQFEDMECFLSPSLFHTIFQTPQLAQLQQSLMRDQTRYCTNITTEFLSQILLQNCYHQRYSLKTGVKRLFKVQFRKCTFYIVIIPKKKSHIP